MEAYEQFLNKVLGDDDDTMWAHYLNNTLVRQCVQCSYDNSMTPNEALRSIIIVLVKMADDDLKEKMLAMATSTSPSYSYKY